jgi:hypothetical protein
MDAPPPSCGTRVTWPARNGGCLARLYEQSQLQTADGEGS